MISFEEARNIVWAKRHFDYPEAANYQTAPWGLQNDTHYQIFDGPWVKLFGNPKSQEYADAISPNNGSWNLVNKTTGEYTHITGPDENGDEFELPDSTPVGETP